MRSLYNFGILLVAVAALSAHGQEPVRFSLKTDVLDFPRCLAQPGSVPLPHMPNDPNLEVAGWETALTPTNHTGEFVFRFLQPTAVGTLFCYGADRVFCSVSNAWHPVSLGRDAARRVKVVPFPAGQLVDAVKITVPAQKDAGAPAAGYRARLPWATLAPVRVVDISKDAAVTVSLRDPAQPPTGLADGLIETSQVLSITRPGPAAPDVFPWTLLTWQQTQSIRGLALFFERDDPALTDVQLYGFAGSGEPPTTGEGAGWDAPPVLASNPGPFWADRFFIIRHGMTGRAVQIRSTNDLGRLALREVLVMTDADKAQPPP